MGGRIAFGILGDRLGAKTRPRRRPARRRRSVRWPMPSSVHLGAFYVAAGVFGFIYAGVMPLYAVLARENFPLRMMGTIIGGTAMAGSLGMAAGPLAGGWIYDTTASYQWLYLDDRGAIGHRGVPDRYDLQAVSEVAFRIRRRWRFDGHDSRCFPMFAVECLARVDPGPTPQAIAFSGTSMPSSADLSGIPSCGRVRKQWLMCNALDPRTRGSARPGSDHELSRSASEAEVALRQASSGR